MDVEAWVDLDLDLPFGPFSVVCSDCNSAYEGGTSHACDEQAILTRVRHLLSKLDGEYGVWKRAEDDDGFDW